MTSKIRIAFAVSALSVAVAAPAAQASGIRGATVYSDSTVTSAQNSSAVVSLGKLGRVE